MIKNLQANVSCFKYCIALTIIIASLCANAQNNNVGVGTLTPDPSAILDLVHNNKGFLVPRMTAVQRMAIVSPANALLVYDTDSSCFFYYKQPALAWVSLCQAGPIGATGATGIAGAQGPTGSQGPTGAQGPAGPTGAAGATGPSGLDGATGATGAVGPTGATGVAGISCWDVNGNGINDPSEDVNGDGSYNSADCAGAQGAAGATGPTGTFTNNAWLLAGNGGTVPGTDFIGTTDLADWVMKTNNTEWMRLTTAGRLGIGTPTPSYKVHVFGGSVVTENPNTFQTTMITSDGGVELYRSPSGAVPTVNGYIDFRDVFTDDYDFRIHWNYSVGTNGALQFSGSTNGNPSTATTYMSILNSSGDVGIATVTPIARLDVRSAFGGPNTTFNVTRDFNGMSGDAAFIGGIDAGFSNTGIYVSQKDNVSLSSPGSYIFNVVNNSVSQMMVNGMGDVGIGTTAPVSKFTVVASGGDGITIQAAASDAGDLIFKESNGFEKSRIYTSPVPALTGLYISSSVDIAGNLCYTGTLSACSDKRYKKNITPITGALSKLMDMQGVMYDWKKEEFPQKKFTDARQIGFIAQDLEKIYPELVMTDAEGYKSVDYSRLTPLLVEALKEQQRLIEKQGGMLQKQDAELLKLKVSNETMRTEYDDRLKKLEAIIGQEAKK
jgi:hypothetical protein